MATEKSREKSSKSSKSKEKKKAGSPSAAVAPPERERNLVALEKSCGTGTQHSPTTSSLVKFNMELDGYAKKGDAKGFELAKTEDSLKS